MQAIWLVASCCFQCATLWRGRTCCKLLWTVLDSWWVCPNEDTSCCLSGLVATLSPAWWLSRALLGAPATRCPCCCQKTCCWTHLGPNLLSSLSGTCWLPAWAIQGFLWLTSALLESLAHGAHGCWPVLPSSMSKSKTVGHWYWSKEIDRRCHGCDEPKVLISLLSTKCWHPQKLYIKMLNSSNCWVSSNLAQKDMLCITDMLYRTRAYTPSCSRHSCWSNTYRKSRWNTVWISCWYTPCWSIGDHYQVVHVVNLCWHHGSKRCINVCACHARCSQDVHAFAH